VLSSPAPTLTGMLKGKSCVILFSQRIDVVAVELNHKGELSRIELIENAVGDE